MNSHILIPVKGPITRVKGLRFSDAQAFVGGYVERYPIGKGEFMVFNEEGKLMNLPYNAFASGVAGFDVVGPAIISSFKFEPEIEQAGNVDEEET